MRAFQRDNPRFRSSNVDYLKLKRRIVKDFKVETIESYFFNSTQNPPSDEQNKFHSWLKLPEANNGPNIRVKLYNLKEKTLECENCRNRMTLQAQKGVDVGIATYALWLSPRFDMIIFSTGDGDLEDMVRLIAEDAGKRVHIVGFDGNISLDLLQYSQGIIYINDIYEEVCDTNAVVPSINPDTII